jgi:hypothetical protein
VNHYTAADPNEAKKQRDRERYARNKDDISNRRREARELKKRPTDPGLAENTSLVEKQASGEPHKSRSYRNRD